MNNRGISGVMPDNIQARSIRLDSCFWTLMNYMILLGNSPRSSISRWKYKQILLKMNKRGTSDIKFNNIRYSKNKLKV